MQKLVEGLNGEPGRGATSPEMIELSIVQSVLNKMDLSAMIVSRGGDILFANNVSFDITGLSRDLVGKCKVYDESLGLTTKDLFENSIEKTIANGGSIKYERNILIDSRVHYLETSIIGFDMLGKECFMILSKDITDLKLSQIHANELNQMLKVIIDNLPVYLFVKDVNDDLRYLIWNKAFANYSKIPAEKVIGKTDFEVFPDFRDAQQFRDDDLNVIERGEMTRKHETYIAADGTSRVVQTFKTLVGRQGRGPLLVGISLDITDIQGIEDELVRERLRAEESDRLKTRFLANMSHEIRTPLNAIVGFAGMLSDAEDEETRQNFLQIISENSELLLQLINDILDLSKIEAGTLEYTRMPMDLFDTCHNLLLTHRNKIQNGVEIYFDNENSPCQFIINEDRNRLLQVMDNLLNNAIKFTDEGEIHYGFVVKDDWIEVYVSDTGRGIPKDKQTEIFERFVKLDSFVQGSGLGLAICKLIVELIGGEMTLDSEVGRGSTFRFTIPYRKDRKRRLEIVAHPHELHATGRMADHTRDKTILVAEDVNSNFLVVKTMIKGRFNVIWARDGAEAVRMAREKNPDLILMDIKMPVMNGLDAAREIRKFNHDVPIVALTANAFDNDRTIAYHAGMNNFLSKPVNREAFEAILAAYLPPVD